MGPSPTSCNDSSPRCDSSSQFPIKTRTKTDGYIWDSAEEQYVVVEIEDIRPDNGCSILNGRGSHRMSQSRSKPEPGNLAHPCIRERSSSNPTEKDCEWHARRVYARDVELLGEGTVIVASNSSAISVYSWHSDVELPFHIPSDAHSGDSSDNYDYSVVYASEAFPPPLRPLPKAHLKDIASTTHEIPQSNITVRARPHFRLFQNPYIRLLSSSMFYGTLGPVGRKKRSMSRAWTTIRTRSRGFTKKINHRSGAQAEGKLGQWWAKYRGAVGKQYAQWMLYLALAVVPTVLIIMLTHFTFNGLVITANPVGVLPKPPSAGPNPDGKPPGQVCTWPEMVCTDGKLGIFKEKLGLEEPGLAL